MFSLEKMSAAPSSSLGLEEPSASGEVYALVLWRPGEGLQWRPVHGAAGLTVLAGSVKFSEKLCKREGNTNALANGQPGPRPSTSP